MKHCSRSRCVAKILEQDLPDQTNLFVSEAVDFTRIRGTRLFYPSAGIDWEMTIGLFSGIVGTLHFQDKGYFQSNFAELQNRDPAGTWYQEVPLFPLPSEWRFIGRDDAPPSAGDHGTLVCERYTNRATEHALSVILDSSNDDDALNRLPEPISVFVYEGGRATESETAWNRWPHLYRVFDRLVDGGLFVTDGLNAGPRQSRGYRRHRPIFEAGAYVRKHGLRDLVGYTFKNVLGLRFTCVGCAGLQTAPLVIWQVRRN